MMFTRNPVKKCVGCIHQSAVFECMGWVASVISYYVYVHGMLANHSFQISFAC